MPLAGPFPHQRMQVRHVNVALGSRFSMFTEYPVVAPSSLDQLVELVMPSQWCFGPPLTHRTDVILNGSS